MKLPYCLGRFVFGGFFLYSGINHLIQRKALAQYVDAKNVPMPEAAVTASGVSDRVRFWEGSFAGFVSIIAQSDFYVGYDSAGQHAAAAAGIPLLSVFKGAISKTFRNRWAPQGWARQIVLNADELESAVTTPAKLHPIGIVQITEH